MTHLQRQSVISSQGGNILLSARDRRELFNEVFKSEMICPDCRELVNNPIITGNINLVNYHCEHCGSWLGDE